jgi:hypothetical protein
LSFCVSTKPRKQDSKKHIKQGQNVVHKNANQDYEKRFHQKRASSINILFNPIDLKIRKL